MEGEFTGLRERREVNPLWEIVKARGGCGKRLSEEIAFGNEV